LSRITISYVSSDIGRALTLVAHPLDEAPTHGKIQRPVFRFPPDTRLTPVLEETKRAPRYEFCPSLLKSLSRVAPSASVSLYDGGLLVPDFSKLFVFVLDSLTLRSSQATVTPGFYCRCGGTRWPPFFQSRLPFVRSPPEHSVFCPQLSKNLGRGIVPKGSVSAARSVFRG